MQRVVIHTWVFLILFLGGYAAHIFSASLWELIERVIGNRKLKARVDELESLIDRHIDPCYLQGEDLEIVGEISSRLHPSTEPGF